MFYLVLVYDTVICVILVFREDEHVYVLGIWPNSTSADTPKHCLCLDPLTTSNKQEKHNVLNRDSKRQLYVSVIQSGTGSRLLVFL